MNNYELDSDEPISKEFYDSVNHKKPFYDIVHTNENVVEEENENGINGNCSEDNENIFSRIIIKTAEPSFDINDKNYNSAEKGRNNKDNDLGIIINNSVSMEKTNKKIKELILSNEKPLNSKNILITELDNNTNSKSNIKEKGYLNTINNQNNLSKNENKKNKVKKKSNKRKFGLPYNSYFYRKIATMIDKEKKIT